MRSRLLWPFLAVSIQACDPAPPETPNIVVNRTKLGFNQEFNSGTFVGATGFNAVTIRNTGVEDLIIQSISAPSSPFALRAGLTLPQTIRYNRDLLVEYTFVPSGAQRYTATSTITSNAANSPTLQIQLSGCGVAAPPATPDLSYCEKSTDFD